MSVLTSMLSGGQTRRLVTLNRPQRRAVTASLDGAVMVVSDNDTDDASLSDIIVQDEPDENCTILVQKTPVFVETSHDQDFDR